MKDKLIILLSLIMFSFLTRIFAGESPNNGYEAVEVYTQLRSRALGVTADFLKLAPDEKIIGVLMEMGYPKAAITLVSMADGAASVYFSNGGGFIGAGEYPETKMASKKLVHEAAEYIQYGHKTSDFPLPAKDQAQFYILTRDGVYVARAGISDLESGKIPLSRLYLTAQAVITEIRKVEQTKERKSNSPTK